MANKNGKQKNDSIALVISSKVQNQFLLSKNTIEHICGSKIKFEV
jgi:hypothetical protein